MLKLLMKEPNHLDISKKGDGRLLMTENKVPDQTIDGGTPSSGFTLSLIIMNFDFDIFRKSTHLKFYLKNIF